MPPGSNIRLISALQFNSEESLHDTKVKQMEQEDDTE
jgi:hypothetical protein